TITHAAGMSAEVYHDLADGAAQSILDEAAKMS
ncbi:MAG: hypothetical protein JWO64_3310, partial [Hyphomicrobiales bacterium]|nr:hypothetical protein [Hyphomicrobiales bacterium]